MTTAIQLRTPLSGVLRTPAQPGLSIQLRTPLSGVLRTPAQPGLSIRRSGRMRAALLLTAVVACTDSTTTTSLQNLDRPTDIAFACYGGLRLTNGGAATADQTIVQTAQPLQACDIRSQPHPDGTSAPVPPGQEVLGAASDPGASSYYAFILQSAPGTIALASWPTTPTTLLTPGDVRVLDADPLTPGKNAITVGEDPVAIATDSRGCYELTVNAGTCDMSVVDINSALNYATNSAVALATDQHVEVNRIDIVNSSGAPLRAKPAAMATEPVSGTIGQACPAQPTGLVYVAYPSCHLVAGVDAATGKIVTGIKYDASGVASIVGGAVECPDECSGAGDRSAGPRPVTLNLERDPDPMSNRRVLAIGSQNSNVVTIAELGLDYRPLSLSNVVLSDSSGKLGVTRVAVSPSIGMGGDQGAINDASALGGKAQFVYAIATDNTIRVANIFNVANQECDTQVDPRYLHDVKTVKTLSCLPVGDPQKPRRAGAKGPGIELPGNAIPTSVGVFRIENLDSDTRLPGTPARMIGYFGVITAANGATYVVNIDDDDFADYVDNNNPIATPIPLDIAHQLRDGLPNRGSLAETLVDNVQVPVCDTNGPDPDAVGGNSGGPRLVGSATRKVPAGTLAAEKLGALPSIRQVLCTGYNGNRVVSELAFAAPIAVRDSVFPDLRGLRSDETWSMTWEGSVSLDDASTFVDGPGVRTSQMVVDGTGLRLVDQSHPYCEAGIQPYDIVQLRGCDPSLGNTDCPLGYTCFVHPSSQVAGLGACMLTNEADRLANACKPFLTSLRRYTVGNASSGSLQLLPRKHVLRTTPIDGCTTDDQCQKLANYALQNAGSAHPSADTTAADTHRYTCAVDDQRAPDVEAGMPPIKRCIQTCGVDADCDAGTVCSKGVCMEGVIPPQACVSAPQRYELRVGEAFAVIGTRSGFVHSIVEDAQGRCVSDLNANPLLIGRLPLRAPACDPAADPRTGRRMDGTFEPNPCSLEVDEVENQPNYVAGSCTLDATASSTVTRKADAIRFRNRGLNLTMVDPTYPGDGRCIGDRLGNLGKVPVVAPLMQTSVRITAGFDPFLIGIRPALPSKVSRGPGESIWILDEGDVLSSTSSTLSTKGRVFRVESQAVGVINVLQ